MSYPVLHLYNPKAETELHTDASAQALAAILLQKQNTGKWAPIAFFSQSTNKAEANYHSFELEMLVIVRAIERFHIYLYGLDFTVITDCNSLVHAVNKANLNPRVARWILALQNYRFKVAHRPGKRMAHVDALSRYVAYANYLPLERELEFKQLQDFEIKEIASNLEFAEDDKFELIDGLVYKKDNDRPRFVVPESMTNSIIRIHHDEMAHCGAEKTFEGIHTTYWFPSMRKKIRDYINNCVTCLIANASRHAQEEDLQLCSPPTKPFQVLHVDHFGPLPQTIDGYKHILVIVDAFTRYTWFFPSRSTTTKETCELFSLLFNIFGIPEEIVSDRGTSFTSLEFSSYLDLSKIKHRKVAVASPWANGLAERVNRFLKSSLTKLIEGPQDWKLHLDKVQYVVNNTVNSSTKMTPSKLLLGYDQRNHKDISLKNMIDQLAEIDNDLLKERQTSRDMAIEANEKIRNYNKLYYDRSHKIPSKYQEGDYVLVRDLLTKPGESKKFKPKYKGPYMITKALNKNRYVVQDVPGFNLKSKPYNTILSTDKIKPWVKPSIVSD